MKIVPTLWQPLISIVSLLLLALHQVTSKAILKDSFESLHNSMDTLTTVKSLGLQLGIWIRRSKFFSLHSRQKSLGSAIFFSLFPCGVSSYALFVSRLCVRVVSSSRGGLGKSLFVGRLTDQLTKLVNNDMVLSRCPSTSLHVTVPLHGNSTDSSMLVDSLLPHGVKANVPLSRVFHLDVAPSVRANN